MADTSPRTLALPRAHWPPSALRLALRDTHGGERRGAGGVTLPWAHGRSDVAMVEGIAKEPILDVHKDGGGDALHNDDEDDVRQEVLAEVDQRMARDLVVGLPVPIQIHLARREGTLHQLTPPGRDRLEEGG